VEYAERNLKAEDGTDLVLFHTGWSTFSNFHPMPMTINGQKYRSVEQYYQVAKAKRFGDVNRVIEILNSRSPRKCKELGKHVQGFDMEVWKKEARSVMKTGLLEKFLQNGSARQKLKDTGRAIIAEATKYDQFWATGLDISDDANAKRDSWPGRNVLGELLMEVRDMIP